MARKEYAGAASDTTLNGSITSSATAFTVASSGGTNYPTGSTGPFVIMIDAGTATEEKILCSSRSADTFAVQTRGYDGTTAAAHDHGAKVQHVLDADSLTDFGRHVYDTADDDHTQYFNAARHDTTSAHGSTVVDHGLIGGLADDDHTQYLNTTRHDTTTRHPKSVLPDLGLREVVKFTSSGTFSKGSYSWLRAVRVRVQGGGGGGGGSAATAAGESSAGNGGGGGGYAESFILASTLLASETVTVGAGGAGGVGGANGSAGGASSFGALVTANGGGGGSHLAAGAANNFGSGAKGGTATAGDIQVTGGGGGAGVRLAANNTGQGGGGGNAVLGGGADNAANGAAGSAGGNYGGGGSGAHSRASDTAKNGGSGAPGIVIVELYA